MPVSGLWEQLLSAICRPQRVEYTKEDLVGGCKGTFVANELHATREDFVIVNKRDQKLKCSSWQLVPGQLNKPSPLTQPCIVYCHCNAGSRLDAEEAIWILVPMGIRVVALDFAGSGNSDGEFVTLGANEVQDLECLVDFLRLGNHTSTIAMWGRSMGAVTALMYCRQDPSVAGVILDSPFAKLTDLMWEQVEAQKIPMRRYLGGAAMRLMRRSVRKRAGFDINDINPIDHVGSAFTPALFGHATDDSFVHPSHSQRLHEAYAGSKHYVKFDGNHNSKRPRFFYDSICIFLHTVLHLSNTSNALRRTMSLDNRRHDNVFDNTSIRRPPRPLNTRMSEGYPQNRLSQLSDGILMGEDLDVDMDLQQVLEMSMADAVENRRSEEPSSKMTRSQVPTIHATHTLDSIPGLPRSPGPVNSSVHSLAPLLEFPPFHSQTSSCLLPTDSMIGLDNHLDCTSTAVLSMHSPMHAHCMAGTTKYESVKTQHVQRPPSTTQPASRAGMLLDTCESEEEYAGYCGVTLDANEQLKIISDPSLDFIPPRVSEDSLIWSLIDDSTTTGSVPQLPGTDSGGL